MAKTKPIGVRFDEDVLSELKEQGKADSPQKALNYLTDFYRQNGKDKDWMLNFAKQAYADHQNKPDTATLNARSVANHDPDKKTPLNERKTRSAVNLQNLNQEQKSNYTINNKPERLPGEDAIDYAGRLNEWKKLNK